jgi:hypothetical protein
MKNNNNNFLHILLFLNLFFQFIGLINGSIPSFQMGELSSRVEKGKEEISKLQQRAMLPKGK